MYPSGSRVSYICINNKESYVGKMWGCGVCDTRRVAPRACGRVCMRRVCAVIPTNVHTYTYLYTYYTLRGAGFANPREWGGADEIEIVRSASRAWVKVQPKVSLYIMFFLVLVELIFV